MNERTNERTHRRVLNNGRPRARWPLATVMHRRAVVTAAVREARGTPFTLQHLAAWRTVAASQSPSQFGSRRCCRDQLAASPRPGPCRARIASCVSVGGSTLLLGALLRTRLILNIFRYVSREARISRQKGPRVRERRVHEQTAQQAQALRAALAASRGAREACWADRFALGISDLRRSLPQSPIHEAARVSNASRAGREEMRLQRDGARRCERTYAVS